MNRPQKRLVAGAAAVAAAAAVIAVPTAAQADRGRSDHLSVVGLTDKGRLVSFSVRNPGRVWSFGTVSGLDAGDSLIGIDYRVQNNRLYGVGDEGGIYTIDVRWARATKVSNLSVDLVGTSFGVDFNPAADRLRVISNTGQNLRHNIADNMTANDGTLTYPAVPPSTTPTTETGVTAAAYTNNDLNATTATTLFDVDTDRDQTVLQSPANSGSLAATGQLNQAAGPAAGFDIYSTLDGGVTVRNQALATLIVGDKAGLYEIDLLTGDADLKGWFPSSRQVVDIAIPTNQKKS